MYPREDLSLSNPEEVALVPSMIDEQTPTSVEDSAAPLEEGKFTPPDIDEVRLGSEWVFQLPTGSEYFGVVDSIKARGQTTTIVQGDIPAGGFFVFSYGPSAVFGSVTTPEGSFEYLKSGGSEVFRRPPVGKLSNDIIRPYPGRGKIIDG
jgi:hypothetical protein